MERQAFHSGFFAKAAALGMSKADVGRTLFEKKAQLGFMTDMVKEVGMPVASTLLKLPGYALIPGALAGGGYWLLMQKIKADRERKKLYTQKLKELDATLQDLESSGVLPPEGGPNVGT